MAVGRLWGVQSSAARTRWFVCPAIPALKYWAIFIASASRTKSRSYFLSKAANLGSRHQAGEGGYLSGDPFLKGKAHVARRVIAGSSMMTPATVGILAGEKNGRRGLKGR